MFHISWLLPPQTCLLNMSTGHALEKERKQWVAKSASIDGPLDVGTKILDFAIFWPKTRKFYFAKGNPRNFEPRRVFWPPPGLYLREVYHVHSIPALNIEPPGHQIPKSEHPNFHPLKAVNRIPTCTCLNPLILPVSWSTRNFELLKHALWSIICYAILEQNFLYKNFATITFLLIPSHAIAFILQTLKKFAIEIRKKWHLTAQQSDMRRAKVKLMMLQI